MVPTLDFIGMIVDDMAASLEFYRRLGMDIPAGAEEQSHVEAGLAGGMTLAWDTAEMIRGIDPAWSPPQGGHRIGLAFRCASPQEVDRTHAAMVAWGYRSGGDPWDAFWGQRYASLLDPDGNAVDLYAPLPGRRQQ